MGLCYFDGVVWAGLAMIWAWLMGVASVLELVFKKLEPMILHGDYVSQPSVGPYDLARKPFLSECGSAL